MLLKSRLLQLLIFIFAQIYSNFAYSDKSTLMQEYYKSLRLDNDSSIVINEATYVSQGDMAITKDSILYTDKLTQCIGIVLVNESRTISALIHSDLFTNDESLIDKYLYEVGDETVYAYIAGGFSDEDLSLGNLYGILQALDKRNIEIVGIKENKRIGEIGSSQSLGVSLSPFLVF